MENGKQMEKEMIEMEQVMQHTLDQVKSKAVANSRDKVVQVTEISV